MEPFTVNVRKPDIRFSALLIYVRFPNVRLSDVRSISICISGYRTSGSNRLQPDNQYQNRFGTGFVSDVRLETFQTFLTSENRFQPVSEPGCPVGSNWNRMSNNRRLKLLSTGRPITGQYCPVIRRCLKSGGIYNRTTFENFQTFTVVV